MLAGAPTSWIGGLKQQKGELLGTRRLTFLMASLKVTENSRRALASEARDVIQASLGGHPRVPASCALTGVRQGDWMVPHHSVAWLFASHAT